MNKYNSLTIDDEKVEKQSYRESKNSNDSNKDAKKNNSTNKNTNKNGIMENKNNKNTNNNGINKSMTLDQLVNSKNITISELENLINVNTEYSKYKSHSKNKHYHLVVTAMYKGSTKENNETLIKISSYHDVKQVEYHYDEKSDNKKTLQIIPGVKSCNENQQYKDILSASTSDISNIIQRDNLRYFMIFEIETRTNGCHIPMAGWRDAFYPIEMDLTPSLKTKQDISKINKINDIFGSLHLNEEFLKKKNDLLEDLKKSLDKNSQDKKSFVNEPHLFEIGHVSEKKRKTDRNAPGKVNNDENKGKEPKDKNYTNLVIRGGWGYENNRALFQINYHNYGSIEENDTDYINLKNILFEKKSKYGYVKKKYENKSEKQFKLLLWEIELKKLEEEIKQIEQLILSSPPSPSSSSSSSSSLTSSNFATETTMKNDMELCWKNYNKSFFNIRNEIEELKMLPYSDFLESFRKIIERNLIGFTKLRFDAMCT